MKDKRICGHAMDVFIFTWTHVKVNCEVVRVNPSSFNMCNLSFPNTEGRKKQTHAYVGKPWKFLLSREHMPMLIEK